MQTFNTAILATSVVVLAGCSSYIKQPEVCIDQKWYGYVQGPPCTPPTKMTASDDTAARLAALEKERQRLADELAAAQRQNGALSSRVSDLERQLADRDREIAALRSGAGDSAKLAADLAASRQLNADLERRISDLEKQLADCEARLAGLRGQLDQSKDNLAKAEKDLLKALQPEIAKGTVSVHQSGDALTINLASSLLFDSGQDQLKAGGTDALKRVGGVLKDFPEKQMHVAGYTDNVAIKGPMQKKFPSNKELSDARASSAAQALRDGGVSSNLSAEGHGDSNPVASNNTAAGRAKNRRVEVIVK
jgi:chemotaxis protein MotB